MGLNPKYIHFTTICLKLYKARIPAEINFEMYRYKQHHFHLFLDFIKMPHRYQFTHKITYFHKNKLHYF